MRWSVKASSVAWESQLLGSLPAVAIDGAKAVGKTTTAEIRATSVVALDSRQVREAALADPESILIRARPVLIDEWQKVPETHAAADAATGVL